jgi:hypothetical protein
VTAALDEVCCVSLPPGVLPALAGLRSRAGVRAREVGGRVWVWWPAGDEAVLRRVLPLPGAEFFARRDGLWYRPGRRLPSSGVPAEASALPLAAVLSPAPVTPQLAQARPAPVGLTVVRDGRPRPATALLCELSEMVRWADAATTRQLTALEAARCGGRVLLRGGRLPAVAGERWWGRSVLVRLGFRPEPELPEAVLASALGLTEGSAALLRAGGVEVVPASAFGPTSRAAVRLAARGAG